MLHIEQYVPEYNIRTTVFLKLRTNSDSAVRCFTWLTILRSADPLVAFNPAIGEVIGKYVPTTILRSSLQTSNGLIPAARELMMLNRLLIKILGSICAFSC